MSQRTTITPVSVHDSLRKHMLVDGFEFVLDLDHSSDGYLQDAVSGKRFLDFFTFFASNPVGLNHPKLTEPDFIQKMGRIAIHNPSNSDLYTTEMAEFVETFSRVGIPDHLKYSFFVAGGSLAVENALKVAFDWKVQLNFRKGYRSEKGHRILHFQEAFHGRSGYTMSMTNTDPNKVKLFPKFDWPRIINPKMRFPLTDAEQARVIAEENMAIAQAERYFEVYKDDIAAIIIEPIQGEGGDNQFRPEFHKALRRLADEHDALLIYDEVQTGVGITGKFWCHEHYVQPDILAFGKKAQVCGILAGTRIDSIETNVFHTSSRINSTWGGNLVDMARFRRYLEIMEEDKLVENAATMGTYLLDRLTRFCESNEFVSNARGKGLFCAFDFPEAHARKAFIDKCYDNGMIILPCGSNSVRFRPPLNVSKSHIDEAFDIIDISLKQAIDLCPALKARKVAYHAHPEPKLD